MDWTGFETRQTFVWNYWRQYERQINKGEKKNSNATWFGKRWWLCCTQTGSLGQTGTETQWKDVKILLYSIRLLIMMMSTSLILKMNSLKPSDTTQLPGVAAQSTLWQKCSEEISAVVKTFFKMQGQFEAFSSNNSRPILPVDHSIAYSPAGTQEKRHRFEAFVHDIY